MGVNLAKGQKISLQKQSGESLTKVTMGLGWDTKKVKGWFGGLKDGPDIDLDASCILFDENKNVTDTVWFRQLQSRDGSIHHTGDNRTGAGDGDDEQILVNLSTVPQNVTSLIFVVNSFTGQTFDQIENAFCRLVDSTTNQEVAKFDLSCSGRHTAQIMVKVHRQNGQWSLSAIGEAASGQTFTDLMPSMLRHL